MLPEVRSSSEVYGQTDAELLGAAIPVAGDAGDQQGGALRPGVLRARLAKNTYGTGCFMLLNTGDKPVPSKKGC
jgi:glycerol kinase